VPNNQASQWPILFELAGSIFDHFQSTNGFIPDWTFGGGTALMLQIDHRESYDIDLFLDDPQIIPYLNPETQGISLNRRPDSYVADGNGVLKLAYKDIGEIDFICCESITDDPTQRAVIRNRDVNLETPAEIIAKKVYYRGWNFQPRDMFDLAAVGDRHGIDYVVSALRQCGLGRCEKALEIIEKAKPDFVRSIIGQLMFRPGTARLVDTAQAMSREYLIETISSLRAASAARNP